MSLSVPVLIIRGLLSFLYLICVPVLINCATYMAGVIGQSLPLVFNGSEFSGTGYSLNISQNDIQGTSILHVECYSLRDASHISYSIHNHGRLYFDIDDILGNVALTVDPITDLASGYSYSATIFCTDRINKSNPTSISTELTVWYFEKNQYSPVFNNNSIVLAVEESHNVIMEPLLYTLRATDRDRGDYGVVVYEILAGNTNGEFELDSNTGELSLRGYLDYERTQAYALIITASNVGSHAEFIDTAMVHIDVIPIDDKIAVFLQHMYSFNFTENSQPQNFLELSCIDQDTDSGIIFYVLSDQHVFSGVRINNTFVLSALMSLDYEEQSIYFLQIDCHSEDYSTDTATVNINVLPVNEFRPERDRPDSQEFVWLLSESPPGTLVASGVPGSDALVSLGYSDRDKGMDHGVINYTMEGSGDVADHFSLDALTGNLTLDVPYELNYCSDANSPFVRFVTIWACDVPNRSLCPKLLIVIYVISGECTLSFSTEAFDIYASEDTSVGSELQHFSCNASGIPNMPLASGNTSLVSGDVDVARTFRLSSDGVLLLERTLDYEARTSYSLLLCCSHDLLGDVVYSTAYVHVLPQNDNQPYFTSPLYVINSFLLPDTAPYLIGRVKALDGDNDLGGKLQYSIVSGNSHSICSVEPLNGTIFLQRKPLCVGDEFPLTFEVQASDGLYTATTTVLVIFSGCQCYCTATDEQQPGDQQLTLYTVIGILATLVVILILVVSVIAVRTCYFYYSSNAAWKETELNLEMQSDG